MTISMNQLNARQIAVTYHGTQMYGAQPYVVHLAAVRQVLTDFAVDSDDLACAAWLHDTIEDTMLARETIAGMFGAHVADLVWAVTGVGSNRKERCAAAYMKIAAFRSDEARILKLADRIANGEASRTLAYATPGDGKLLNMYRREQAGFEKELALHACASPIPSMLVRLQTALS